MSRASKSNLLKFPVQPTITADVKRCSLCGRNHADMRFTKMGRPWVSRKIRYTHYAMCPKVMQFLFMAVTA